MICGMMLVISSHSSQRLFPGNAEVTAFIMGTERERAQKTHPLIRSHGFIEKSLWGRTHTNDES